MVAERRANRVRRVGKEESGMAVNNVFGVALLRKVRECSEIERGEKTKVVDVHERAVRLGVLKPRRMKTTTAGLAIGAKMMLDLEFRRPNMFGFKVLGSLW